MALGDLVDVFGFGAFPGDGSEQQLFTQTN
jgi:hypothetical protein